MANVKLSPPWYTFANEIKYTYGLSDYIMVNELIQTDASYTLPINVCNNSIAKALRAVLPLSQSFGDVVVNIVIFNNKGNVVVPENIVYTKETLAQTFCTALYKNPLFVGTVIPSLPPIVAGTVGDVVVIIKPYVVQFFNDDISDLCSNFNEVAAKVFTEVSTLLYADALKVSFSTYDKKCQLQKDIFCPNSCRC